jgi:hypothetical protein
LTSAADHQRDYPKRATKRAPLMVRFPQHSSEPHVAWWKSCKQSFAFPLRFPLKCSVVNGNRSFLPGQDALAKPLEWVNHADGSFPTAMAQRDYAVARACCCQIRSVLFTD